MYSLGERLSSCGTFSINCGSGSIICLFRFRSKIIRVININIIIIVVQGCGFREHEQVLHQVF